MFRFSPSFKLIPLVLASTALISACGGGDDSPEPKGKWTAGDLHVHTVQSDDSRTTQTLDFVLGKAFNSYKLDWTALTNHLRSTKYDNNANLLPAPLAFAYGMGQYEIPRFKALQAAGTYADKLIYSGAEWDMPTHDHFGVAMFEGATREVSTSGFKEFQYAFTNTAEATFDPADLARFKQKYPQRMHGTHADALQALAWLKANYASTSFTTINHPSRNPGKYTIKDLREMNDLAPDIVFMLEGMVGNQMEPDRGGYTSAYIDANLPNRTYGGVDAMVAQVGGMWDALLGEGRRIWNISTSDSHFDIDAQSNSSGYYPGEYAKNHLWMAESATGVAGLQKSLRDGRMFGVYGDLINALDFRVAGASGYGFMGQEIQAANGENVTVTVRFKSPAVNNYRKPVTGTALVNMKPVVDHIDLIVGDVGAKALPGTPAYGVPTNSSARVLRRLTAADWKLDAEGYFSVQVQVEAKKNQYFRLRGTNLAPNVAGLTANGEPLPDQKTTGADNTARVNAINDRNYASLWFYSNPVFVKVTP